MAADYDRLFQPADGADASDAAGADYDLDGPSPMPVLPPLPNVPKSNGQAETPPMPVDWNPPDRPERLLMPVDYHPLSEPPVVTENPDETDQFADDDLPPPLPNTPNPNGKPVPPPMPIDWTPPIQPESPVVQPDSASAPPAARIPVSPDPGRHARHSRQGHGVAPNPKLVARAKPHNSHRAASPHNNGKTAGPLLTREQRREPPAAPTSPATDYAYPRIAPVGPLRAAESAAVQRDSILVQRPTVIRPVSRQRWRRWIHTLTRINVGLLRDEKYELELQNRIRRTVRGSYEIAVLGLKGGVGKTSVTAALGSAFAQLRGDRILAVDADPVAGNLADRVGRQTTATVADLMANRALSNYNDVRAHTSMNAVRLEVLSAAEYSGAMPRLGAEDWKRALAMVPRYYSLVLADCAADLAGPAVRGVLPAASGLVIMSSASADGARQAGITVDWLCSNGFRDLLNRACVVVNHVTAGTSKNATDEVVRQFQQCVPPGRVIVLPWDEHIAAGSEIDLDRLSAAYRRKITELAAALSDDFDRGERR